MIVADLHGNRLNSTSCCESPDLPNNPARAPRMQEVCHGGPEYRVKGGGCMSHLLLEDCIRLKNRIPGRFHFLLAIMSGRAGDFPICKGRACSTSSSAAASGNDALRRRCPRGVFEISRELPARGAPIHGVFISPVVRTIAT